MLYGYTHTYLYKINLRLRLKMQCNLDMYEKILNNAKKKSKTRYSTDRQSNRVNKLILVDVQSINYIYYLFTSIIIIIH